MIYTLIALLGISQMVMFYLLYSIYSTKKLEKKYKNIPNGSIILEPIPKTLKYKDVEPDYKTIYDVIESAISENWKGEVTVETSLMMSWILNIVSNDGSVKVMACLWYNRKLYIDNFIVESNNNHIYISNDDMDNTIENDIKIFCWKYIIDHYKSNNEDIREKYISTIKDISSNLKTLNRSRKLNGILNGQNESEIVENKC